jgi:hypothetical protein
MSTNAKTDTQNPQEAVLSILSTEECQHIHEASLKILERTGQEQCLLLYILFRILIRINDEIC